MIKSCSYCKNKLKGDKDEITMWWADEEKTYCNNDCLEIDVYPQPRGIQWHRCPKCNEWLDFLAFSIGYNCDKCKITYGFIGKWMRGEE